MKIDKTKPISKMIIYKSIAYYLYLKNNNNELFLELNSIIKNGNHIRYLTVLLTLNLIEVISDDHIKLN